MIYVIAPTYHHAKMYCGGYGPEGRAEPINIRDRKQVRVVLNPEDTHGVRLLPTDEIVVYAAECWFDYSQSPRVDPYELKEMLLQRCW